MEFLVLWANGFLFFGFFAFLDNRYSPNVNWLKTGLWCAFWWIVVLDFMWQFFKSLLGYKPNKDQ
jgi:hypothetical protein